MPLSRSDLRPCAVYRWFAVTGQLLYVGCAHDPDKRWREHRVMTEWATKLAARRTVDWYDTTSEAIDAELAAIKTEGPLFNRHRANVRWPRADLRWFESPGEPAVPCYYAGDERWLVGHDSIRQRVGPARLDQLLASA